MKNVIIFLGLALLVGCSGGHKYTTGDFKVAEEVCAHHGGLENFTVTFIDSLDRHTRYYVNCKDGIHITKNVPIGDTK